MCVFVPLFAFIYSFIPIRVYLSAGIISCGLERGIIAFFIRNKFSSRSDKQHVLKFVITRSNARYTRAECGVRYTDGVTNGQTASDSRSDRITKRKWRNRCYGLNYPAVYTTRNSVACDRENKRRNLVRRILNKVPREFNTSKKKDQDFTNQEVCTSRRFRDPENSDRHRRKMTRVYFSHARCSRV